ncbi:hypothetical protein [Pseudomonas sp. VI4.1]|uniref:hypothetical protein n=1 Tax=Pseudomonas sp. VI4.1 TaxID=1941346 RepID=UPI0009D583E6|nr:hypothetical protein [Pseudomonas sp. VI4.1]OPK07404.1 hypothetical protein BZ163_27675 [Pseudomonas sp. VI4.1]
MIAATTATTSPGDNALKLLTSLWNLISPDRRPDREKVRERDFTAAVNSLKTLSTTDRGGMSIDPEEVREQITSSREQLRHLVHKPGAPSRPLKVMRNIQVEQEATLSVEAPIDAQDCIEVVAWRRLPSGDSVRYLGLQCTSTGRFAVATASLFSGGTESLPPWVDGNTNRLVASALQSAELHWYVTVSEAMDAWDAAL